MKSRIFPFIFLLIFSFLILLFRLFYLTIIKGEEYRQLSEGNRIKILRIPALRGVIYDRNEKVLVRNRPEGREYVYKEITAHILGYLGEADENEITINDKRAYTSYSNYPDQEIKILVGKTGIEKAYDNLLRGVDGGTLVETDALGKVVREIKKIEPQEGDNLYLTLDLGLQQKAFEAIKNQKAGIVASNPNTGEILALVSSPSFDPNAFTQNQSKEINNILNDFKKPMFNRAIAGLYPPGSTFKIITAIAGLEEGKINSETQIEDTGEIRVGKFVFGNWYFNQYGKTEGLVNIVKAIKRSNDIYFYKVGEWVGITRLSHWAKFLGLGEPLGIDIPGEAGGLIPTPEWKKENKLESWYLGDTYITAIGQGDLQLTPLQVNFMTSVIAGGGKLCRPHIAKTTGEKIDDGAGSGSSRVDDKKKSVITASRPRVNYSNFCRDLRIKEEHLKLIKEGMRQACSPGDDNDPGGTGWPLFKFKVQNEKLKIDDRFTPLGNDWLEVPVGCKTGTAEYGDPQDKTHAWFTVFAPFDNPEIVVTVLLEGAGEGSSEAGPIAKNLLKYWFENKDEREKYKI